MAGDDGKVGAQNFFASLKLMDGLPRKFINDMEAFFISKLDKIDASTNQRREHEGNLCAVKATSGACLPLAPAPRSPPAQECTV